MNHCVSSSQLLQNIVVLTFIATFLFYLDNNCEDDAIVCWPFLILSCVWILLNLMWWMADIVTFAENLRVSGDGCPLKQNL